MRLPAFRQLFVPLLFGAGTAAYLFRAACARGLARLAIPIEPISAALLVAIAAVTLAERFRPANRAWNYGFAEDPVRATTRLLRDGFYFLFVAQVSALCIALCAARLEGLRRFALWPSAAPFAVRLALAFLLVELCDYWFHRACHRFPLLWQFHSTHHVITEVTGLKALRTHPVDNLFFYLARTAPLLLLGAGAGELIAVTYLGSLLGILAHANVELDERWLGLVINFPRFHGVHHSSSLRESNSNYGCHTVIWDRVFGTFRADHEGTLEVGVAPVRARTLWQELFWPFYRRVS